MSMPNLLLSSAGLQEIKEEGAGGGDNDGNGDVSEKEKDETSSVVSTTSSSTFSRASMRFRVPSLRRRVTVTDGKLDSATPTSIPNTPNSNTSSITTNNSNHHYTHSPPTLTTPAGGVSPRAVSISAYSTHNNNHSPVTKRNQQHIRSRRTSEVQSEDDTASLGPQVGLEITRDRGDSSWGVGDEVVMGLE